MSDRYDSLDSLIREEAMIVIEIQGQLAAQASKRAGTPSADSPDGGEIELPPD